MTPQEWLEAYRNAWQTADVTGIGDIFTEDATYHETPYDEPFRGRDGIREYWARVTAVQSDVLLRYGTPVTEGGRTAVEWWVTMLSSGEPITLAGEFLLEFDEAGLCSRLREYWHFAPGAQEPFPGWGS